jgi:threonine/homoserine/homoserine lactone efflux protein
MNPLFYSMLAFMFVAVMTPGPNNIMLAASGANFGFKRTIPHMVGIMAGFFTLLLLVGLGLGQLFEAVPVVRQALRIASLSFIFYLAWRIANSGTSASDKKEGRPIRFWEGALFQLVNPKAVVMSIAVTATFISPDIDFMPQFVVLVISFIILTLISLVSWAGFGLVIGRVISSPGHQRIFNVVMALLLIGSILPVAADIFI